MNNHEKAIGVQIRDGKLGKLFTKGVSGNPSGRPKGNPKVKEILKIHTVEATKKLVELLYTEKEQMRFMVAREILNRTECKSAGCKYGGQGNMDVRSQIRTVLLERPNECLRDEPE